MKKLIVAVIFSCCAFLYSSAKAEKNYQITDVGGGLELVAKSNPAWLDCPITHYGLRHNGKEILSPRFKILCDDDARLLTFYSGGMEVYVYCSLTGDRLLFYEIEETEIYNLGVLYKKDEHGCYNLEISYLLESGEQKVITQALLPKKRKK